MERERKPPEKGAASAISKIPLERLHFTAFLASNPNYFGNVSKLKGDSISTPTPQTFRE